MKRKSIISVIGGCFALLLLSSLSARAVDIDLTGKVFKQGGKIVVTSTGTVSASLIYTMDLAGSGTSTGSFVPLFGNGDYETAVAKLDPEAVSYLHFVLANLSGKVPALLGMQQGFNQVDGAPLVGGTTGTLITKGRVSLKVNKKGNVTASLTNMFFREKTSAGKKVPFTGNYTLTSGTLSVKPLVATSSTAQPAIVTLLNAHFCITGPDAYTFIRLHRGSSKSAFFVMQNNGPSTDDFVLKSAPLPTGITARFFDGKTDITSQVTTTGYPITALASSGLKLIKTKIAASGKATPGSAQLTISLSRVADTSVFDDAGASLYILH